MSRFFAGGSDSDSESSSEDEQIIKPSQQNIQQTIVVSSGMKISQTHTHFVFRF